MKYRLLLLTGSFILGALIFSALGGPGLGIIYALLWFDKVILGFAGVIRYFGIEFTTLCTILTGLLYGPVLALIFIITVIPFFHAVKFIALPLYEPDWPLFVPHYYNVVDAIGAAIAGMLIGWPMVWVMAIVLIARGIMYPVIDFYLLDRGVNFFTIPPTAVFNLLLVWYFGSFFAGLAGLQGY